MHQNQVSKKQGNQALSFITAQFIATIALSAVLLLFGNTEAYSALAGGLIATMANAWFAVKVFRARSGVKEKETAETFLATFYVGEIYKFIFTGAMFIMAFVLIKPVNVIALLATYFLIHLTPAVINVFSKDDISGIRNKEK